MRMHHSKLVLLIVIFFCTDVNAQSDNYARDIVKQLSSEEFKGRGYVENGDKIAADFIRTEFNNLGLKPFTNKYFQEFYITVNTFPSEIELIVNGQKLQAGYDFLVTSGSPTISGQFETVFLSIEDILSDEKLGQKLSNSVGKYLIIESIAGYELEEAEFDRFDEVVRFLKYHPNNPSIGTIELTNEKLTWNGSQVQHPKSSFTVIEDSLEKPITSIGVNLKSALETKFTTQNVVGYIKGYNSDSLIVIMAHYDHFGKMGNALFPGANDNASGTAMMLSLAKHYSKNKPNYNIAFIAFGAEELGLLGSKYFVENPLFDLNRIKFLLNFDLAGTGDDGIQVVNGSVYKDKFDLLSSINQDQKLLPQVKIRGKACNSDHCFFDEQGVPGFYIYTIGGIQAYHDVYDKYETLSFTEFEDYFTLMIEFLERL